MAKITKYPRKGFPEDPEDNLDDDYEDDFDEEDEEEDDEELLWPARRKKEDDSEESGHVVRNIIIAMFLVFIGVMVFIFREDIDFYKLKNLVNIGEPAAVEAVLSGTSIAYEASEANRFGVYKGQIVVLTRSKLAAYGLEGEEQQVQQVSLATPTLTADGKYFAYFDHGMETVTVADAEKILFEKEFDNDIVCAHVNESGYLSVVTAASGYKTILTVYSPSFEEWFQWAEAEDYYLDVDVSENGKQVIAAGIGSSNGVFTSFVDLFDVTTGERKRAAEGVCGMIVSCDFRPDGTAVIIGDEKILFLKANGEIYGSFDATGKVIGLCARDSEYVIVQLLDTSESQKSELVWLDASGNVSARLELMGKIKSLSSYQGTAAVLTESSLAIYSRSGTERQQVPVNMDMQQAILFGENNCVLFGMNRVYLYQ